MKYSIIYSFFFCFLVQLYGQTVSPSQALYIPNEVYIKIKDSVDISWDISKREQELSSFFYLQKTLQALGIVHIQSSFYFSNSPVLQRILRVQFTDSLSMEYFLVEAGSIPQVEYVEKIPMNYIDFTPNDPSYGSQWYLTKINAADAWDITTGSSQIRIAIVDNAIQTNHPDLSNNMLPGYDVADLDNNPNPPNSTFDHGTHVAGISAAVTNNGIGIAGIGYNCKIIPVKASLSSGSNNDIGYGYEGITWASQNGAKIINCSWGSTTYSSTAQLVVNNAWNAGCIIVAAAGNSNTSTLTYPAAYSNVVAVANSNQNDQRYFDSNYGSWVDITAPGTSMLSTIPYGSYGSMTGTSMACPLTAGLLGLVWSVNLNASKTSVISCVTSTAAPLTWSGGGAGRIDAYAAVNCAIGSPSNDNCANAINLNVNTSCITTFGTVDGATDDGFPTLPTCNGSSATQYGVFYRFTAQASTASIVVAPTVVSSSGLDPVVTVYSGSNCNSLNEIPGGCIDASGTGGTETLNLTGLTSGTTYWIRVYDWGSLQPPIGNGGFNICIYNTCNAPPAPSANSASNITQTGFQANWGTVSGATSYRLDVSTSSTFSNYVVGYNDLNVSNVNSYNVNGLSANTTYYYRVRAFTNCASSNSNTISQITLSSTPTTDPCTSITPISGCGSGNNQTYPGGGTGAWFTSTTNPCGYNSPGIEKIYSFVAPSTGTYNIEVTSASGFVDYFWKSGSCNSNGWSCISDINSPGTYGSMSWTAGTTYYILLDDENTISGTHSFYVNCPSTPSNPPNQPGQISGNLSVCQGDVETYSILPVPTATSYTWQLPSGWSGSSTSNSIQVTVGANSGSITVTADNSFGSSSPSTQPVTVNSAPNISINPPSATICSGGNGVQLQASGTAQNYTWSPSTGLNATTGQTVTANPTSNTTYTVTGNNGGCTATSQVAVTISNQANAVIYPNNPVMCSNSSITLSTTSGSSYAWSGPNGYASSSQVITINTPGNYAVTVTNPGGCNGTANTSVNVIQSPALVVNAGTNQVIGVGGSATLGGSPVATGGTAPYTYTWTPTSSLNDPTLSNPLASPSTNTTYSVLVTDANGCSESATVSVTISGSTNCAISINPNPITVSASQGTHQINLTIDPGCPWTVTENCNWLVFTNTSGNGPSTLNFTVDQNSLVTSRTCLVNINGTTVAITQNPCTAPSVDFTASVQAGIIPFSVNFNDNSTNLPTSWEWTFAGGTPSTSTLQNPTVIYNSGGIYDVTLKASNQCGNNVITKLNYIGALSTSNENSNLDIQNLLIFPNPTQGQFTISGDVLSNETIYLELISTLGQVVFTRLLTPQANRISEIIKVDNLSSGSYILKLKANEQNAYFKFMIE